MERHLDAAPQVIAVASAPGAPGPHALAPNLAIRAGMRGRQANRKVCLLDTTAESPLEAHAGTTVPDVVELPAGPLDTDHLDRLLVQHAGWNLHLLRGSVSSVEAGARQDHLELLRNVLTELRKRFDYVFVATSVLDLYSAAGTELLADSDQLCLEVPDNMATVLNTAMWVRSWSDQREADRQEPRVGFAFTPRGDGHLTLTEARAQLPGVRELGTLPMPNKSRSIDPTSLSAVGPDPVVGTALDRILYEITRDLSFKPRRNEWWRY